MPSNLPPGVTESMIPGNRPEDIVWEKVHEQIDGDSTEFMLTPEDAHIVWALGLASFIELGKWKATFPHNR